MSNASWCRLSCRIVAAMLCYMLGCRLRDDVDTTRRNVGGARLIFPPSQRISSTTSSLSTNRSLTKLTNTLSRRSFQSLKMAKPLVVPALTRHTATVIWAHGLGDSGAGW